MPPTISPDGCCERTGCPGRSPGSVSARVQIVRWIPWYQWAGLAAHIVRNTSYTLLKKNRAVDLTTTFDEEIHASGHESASPVTILEHAEDAELIKNAMNELPAEFREILTLRHQESYLTRKSVRSSKSQSARLCRDWLAPGRS